MSSLTRVSASLIDGDFAGGGDPSLQKVLLTGDWQPETPQQYARQITLAQHIAADHPDLAYGLDCGDLVAGETVEDGSSPTYNLFNLFWEAVDGLPYGRNDHYVISGNHDWVYASGITGADAESDSYFLRSQERMFYYFIRDNIVYICLGSMAHVGGTIPPYVQSWFERLVLNNPDRNIVVMSHYPPNGTHQGNTSNNDPTPMLTFLAANPGAISLWLYGHHHADLDDLFTHEVHYGTQFCFIGVGLPSAMDSSPYAIIYSILQMEDRSANAKIVRWNDDLRAIVAGQDVDFAFRFPVRLTSDVEHDGRHEGRYTLFTAPVTVAFDVGAPSETTITGHHIVSNRKGIDVQGNNAVADVWYVPGNPATPWFSYNAGSAFGAQRRSGVDTNFTAAAVIKASDGSSQGISALVEVAYLGADGLVQFPLMTTTAAAANVVAGTDGKLTRSTSLRATKTDIQEITLDEAMAAMEIPAVAFRSVLPGDNPDTTYFGFIAEDVAEHQEKLATFENGNLQGVQYDRMAVVHHVLIKALRDEVLDLGKRLKNLEGGK